MPGRILTVVAAVLLAFGVAPSAREAPLKNGHLAESVSRKLSKAPPGARRRLVVGGRWYHATSAWNKPLPANVPIAPNSGSLIDALVNRWCPRGSCLGPTSVSVPPVWVVSRKTPPVTVQLNFPRCDAREFRAPIPAWASPEGPPEGDMTLMVKETGVEWDFFKMTPPGAQPLSSGPTCGPTSNWAATVVKRASPGWIGSGTVRGAPRASGTLFGSGLIRPRDTKKRGVTSWDHAIALAYPGTLARSFAWPAIHSDGRCDDARSCLPMGARLQLDPAVNCASWPTLGEMWQRQLCRTLQKFGLIVVDTGSALLIQNPISLGSYRYPWEPTWRTLPADLAGRLRVIDWTKWTGKAP